VISVPTLYIYSQCTVFALSALYYRGQTRSISWLNGIKGDLNQALVTLGLALHIIVVFTNCSLGFFVLSVVIFGLSAPEKWLVRKIISKMTYNLSTGLLNTTIPYYMIPALYYYYRFHVTQSCTEQSVSTPRNMRQKYVPMTTDKSRSNFMHNDQHAQPLKARKISALCCRHPHGVLR